MSKDVDPSPYTKMVNLANSKESTQTAMLTALVNIKEQ